KVKYVYPRDIVVIKELFPDLVNAGLSSVEKKKAKVYENCDVIEGRGFGKLGDRRIFIKVIDTCNDFAIRRGPFEFAAIEGASFEHLSDVHVGDERLIRVLQDNRMRVCAPIEVDGLYDIVVYQFVRLFMCKDELCAIFDFAYDVGGFSKTMLTKVGGKDNENARGIFYSYLYSGRLEPLRMDIEECEKWRIWNDMYGFEWARNYYGTQEVPMHRTG
ncbi:MAG: hypothetical protein LBC41_04565, partial [Clostridiales bacterium]|nr:hypothetical protein [Clostridiales bacterium]